MSNTNRMPRIKPSIPQSLKEMAEKEASKNGVSFPIFIVGVLLSYAREVKRFPRSVKSDAILFACENTDQVPIDISLSPGEKRKIKIAVAENGVTTRIFTIAALKDYIHNSKKPKSGTKIEIH